jgi:hypothetical protein
MGGGLEVFLELGIFGVGESILIAHIGNPGHVGDRNCIRERARGNVAGQFGEEAPKQGFGVWNIDRRKGGHAATVRWGQPEASIELLVEGEPGGNTTHTRA